MNKNHEGQNEVLEGVLAEFAKLLSRANPVTSRLSVIS